MRRVIKPIGSCPDGLLLGSVINSLNDISIKKLKDDISDTIYKGEYTREGKSESRVREKLNEFYFYKCAYCETFCKAEIEHYRPKKAVQGDSQHDGYYWLCYEWTNLLPSCRYCNTEGGKGNKFPILGSRVYLPPIEENVLNLLKNNISHPYLQLERPVLINPEVDEPKAFLGFSIDENKIGLKIKGIDIENRGSGTIEICNLNRIYLKLDRQKAVIYNIVQSLKMPFKLLAEGIIKQELLFDTFKIYIDQIQSDSENSDLTHTLLRWYILDKVENFNEIIIPFLDDNEGEIILEAFKVYKN